MTGHKGIRLDCWDYSWEGFYFITICVKNRASLFGEVTNEKVVLSPLGVYAQKCWLEIPEHFAHVVLDEHIVMPDHIHGILALDDCIRPALTSKNAERVKPPTGGSLGHVVGCYKTAVSKWSKANGYAEFAWQARFFDHVIRNDRSLSAVREYISTNPLSWELERNNPENLGEIF